MEISSTAFHHNAMIPAKYTCLGEDINPPLKIKNIPAEAKSLALIVDDPDAPSKTFVHWVVFDIPAIEEIKEKSIPGKQGINDFQEKNYKGPCPPTGTHRYYFKLYALDVKINLEEGITKENLENAMKGHVIAQSELIGIFKKD